MTAIEARNLTDQANAPAETNARLRKAIKQTAEDGVSSIVLTEATPEMEAWLKENGYTILNHDSTSITISW